MLRNIVKDFVKPRRVEFEQKEEHKEGTIERYGKFVAEPLECGYGTTIGNSLRRVMLSSLPGSAITSVCIDGVSHEFATINGCVEDVTEIVLNLKEIVLQGLGKEEFHLTLEANGPGEVTAGMISSDLSVRVINPDHHICTLNEDGKIRMQMVAKIGRGYVTAEFNKTENDPVNAIIIDSIFSPVRKVNMVVTNARVGQRTDYDKLTLEVWTNGSLSPQEALEGAAYILRDQVGVFAGTEEIKAEETVEHSVIDIDKPKFNDNLFRRIDELELSVRSSNCLENADIKYIGELVVRTEGEMLRTKNFGRKSLNEIKEILSEMGLGLGMKLEGFPAREILEKMTENASNSMND
ncbi:MAG: DNA-directed RNA polymerase subunit alpha [Deltaproteobacteria bacterium]|nr:DNA-directed RNA polymerase subunit alpha [Deltaproteobacteria bacterium]